ncbi:hypothetical protein ACE6H2_013708 [Prunus campanulata]
MLLFLPQRRLVQSQPAGSSDSSAEMEEMGWFLDVCIWRLRYFYRASLFSSSITDFLAFFSISFSVHRLPCLLLLHQFRFPFVIPVCYSPGLSLCSFIRAPVLCLNTPKSKGLDIWILLSFSRKEDVRITLWGDTTKTSDSQALQQLTSPIFAAFTRLKVNNFKGQDIHQREDKS